MKEHKQNFLKRFSSSQKRYPIVAGLAASLYPTLYYYSNNFSMLDTWEHFAYLMGLFVLVPVAIFFLLHKLSQLQFFSKYKKYVIPFLSVFVFFFILKTLLYIPIERKLIAYSVIAGALFAYFLHKHVNKLIIFQLLMAVMAFCVLAKEIFNRLTYDDSWKEQPDAIEQVVFAEKPNVYFLEPDGYVGPEELEKPPYSFNNSKFERYLFKNSFTSYPDFRTNYITTQASNGATFTMKHHYYDFNLDLEEVERATDIILSSNPVLNAFKNNGYETYFVSSTRYFMLDRPTLGYHHTNIDYQDIPYIHKGIAEPRPVVQPFLNFLNDGIKKPKFFFVQFLYPWHVSSRENQSEGVEKERENYLERLQKANGMLTEMIDSILEKDPNALIIIMADHGGYVGLKYTKERYAPIEDTTLIKSIFKTKLAIRWPENEVPKYDEEMDSPVNVFRIIFAHLSGNAAYAKNLQPDESFIIHKNEVKAGVYQYYDDAGEMMFQKVEPKSK